MRETTGNRDARLLTSFCWTFVGAALCAPAAAQVPVLFESQKLLPSQPDGQFGADVEMASERLLVGARGADDFRGAVYVFAKRQGSWVQQARLEASDGQPHDGFGSAMDGFGPVIAVGAQSRDNPGLWDGATYLFELGPNGWQETTILTPPTETDLFGAGIAVEGDRLAVGAPGGPRRAYVYLRTATGWVLEQELNGPITSNDYGDTLAMEGNTLALGTPIHQGANAGAVYVYVRGPGGWFEQTILTATGGTAFSGLGRDVEISGNTLLATAHRENTSSAAAYVFERAGGAWSETARFEALTPQTFSDFGWAVALEGDHAIVSYRGDSTVLEDAGSLYWYQRSGGTWNLRGILRASDAAIDDGLGRGVAIHGSTVFAGAFSPPTGAVYVFELDCGATRPYCTATPNSTGRSAQMGALGNLSVTADALELVADGCPPGQPARFVYGSLADETPFGNGLLCIGAGGSGVLFVEPVVTTDADGRASLPIDFADLPAITPGSTWHFQLWFRDPAAGGASFDTSDGLEATFCP